MADGRKKPRRRRSSDDLPELTLLEKSIAKYLRFQCPTKKGMLMGTQVVYFNGSKAVECLLESKWSSQSAKSSEKDKTPICFSSKHDAVQILRRFLDHEMFRRVVKVYKDKATPSDTADDPSHSVRQRRTPTDTTTTVNDDDSKEKDKAKKKKFKFELHGDQAFVDSVNDLYVWIYSPTTIKQYLIGGLLVLGCIAVCLFPLWPTQVRTGVYYLSIVLASLLGSLLSLALLRYVIFALIWLITAGKIKFWLLPNLTEDVGFLDSFIPVYTLSLTGTGEKKKKRPECPSEIAQKSEKEENEVTIDRSIAAEDTDEATKRRKLAEDGFEVLSKDELEIK